MTRAHHDATRRPAASTTTPTYGAVEMTILPITLVCVGGIAPRLLQPLRADQTLEHVRHHRELDRSLGGQAFGLELALFELIPRLDDDKPLRRAVLDLKRDVHNARVTRLDRDQLAAIEARLVGRDRQLLTTWLDTIDERTMVTERGRHALRHENDRGQRAVLDACVAPAMLEGLALASPTLVHDVVEARAERRLSHRSRSRTVRAAYTQVTSAALKPSPSSPFTTAQVVPAAGFDRAAMGLDGRTAALARPVSDELASILDRAITKSTMYDVVVSNLVARHGTNARGVPFLPFLHELLRDRETMGEIRRAIGDDADAITRARAAGPSGPPASTIARPPGQLPPVATVIWQLAGAPSEGTHRDPGSVGADHVVVHQVFAAVGGLLARWLLSAPREQRRAMAEQMRSWFAELNDGGAPYELSAGSEGAASRQLGAGPLRPVNWPSERPSRLDGSALRTADLLLNHDPTTNGVHLTSTAGQVVTVVHLGMAAPSLIDVPARVLLTISSPWICGPDLVPLAPDERSGDPVRHHPRVVHGDIVLRRACWQVPVVEVPVRREGERAFAHFARVDEWRASHGMPREVFVCPERAGPAFPARGNEPIWIDLAAPPALDLLGTIAAEAPALRITEALPSSSDSWWATASGEVRATEFASVIRARSDLASSRDGRKES